MYDIKGSPIWNYFRIKCIS